MTSSPRGDYGRDLNSRLPHLCEWVHDPSEFACIEGSRILQHHTSGYLVSIKHAAGVAPTDLKRAFREIEVLTTLDHPCIASFAGYCVIGKSWEVQIATLFLPGASFDGVISSPPAWWTPTTMAIAVTGIVLEWLKSTPPACSTGTYDPPTFSSILTIGPGSAALES
jgi:hypothetical protein